MNEKYLTIREAMEVMKIKSVVTMYKYIKDDKTLPAVKVGRFYRIKQSDLDKFMTNDK